MDTSTIWQQLQRVQKAISQGSRETQDTAIAALQDTLAACLTALWPSFVYPLLTDVLTFFRIRQPSITIPPPACWQA